jgi:hypothetical protein
MKLSMHLGHAAATRRRAARHDLPWTWGSVLRLGRVNGALLSAMLGEAELGSGATQQVHVHAGSNYTGAIAMRRLIPTVFVAAMLAACSESPTTPDADTTPAERPSLSVSVPGTNITINSVACSLISPSTGGVKCSYDVSNPDGLMVNTYPSANLKIDYQCVNASTGKVQSTGTVWRWAWGYHEGLTATSISATDEALTNPTLPNYYTRADKKYNACKGKQTGVPTHYELVYWDLVVDNWYSGQPAADYLYACLGSDTSRGCAVQ